MRCDAMQFHCTTFNSSHRIGSHRIENSIQTLIFNWPLYALYVHAHFKVGKQVRLATDRIINENQILFNLNPIFNRNVRKPFVTRLSLSMAIEAYKGKLSSIVWSKCRMKFHGQKPLLRYDQWSMINELLFVIHMIYLW